MKFICFGDENMVKAENLVKRYGANYALNDVSFEIGEGEIVGLLPLGAGIKNLGQDKPPQNGAGYGNNRR